MIRIRIFYSKTEPLRYTSNLDMQKIWERTFRRAELPVIHSQGFHPQPRIHQAAPLPLGITSTAEILDTWIAIDLSTSEISKSLMHSSPPGIEISALEIIPQNLPNLQTAIIRSDYLVTLPDEISIDELKHQVEILLASPALSRERRGKNYDLRPLVISLLVQSTENQNTLYMTLSAREGATGRPDEVLDALGVDPLACKIQRVALHFS